jgi:hypothetical protein
MGVIVLTFEIEIFPLRIARPSDAMITTVSIGDQYTVTYLQWNDYEWRSTRLVRPGTLGSLDQRGVSEPVSSQLGGPTDCGPTEESSPFTVVADSIFR